MRRRLGFVGSWVAVCAILALAASAVAAVEEKVFEKGEYKLVLNGQTVKQIVWKGTPLFETYYFILAGTDKETMTRFNLAGSVVTRGAPPLVETTGADGETVLSLDAELPETKNAVRLKQEFRLFPDRLEFTYEVTALKDLHPWFREKKGESAATFDRAAADYAYVMFFYWLIHSYDPRLWTDQVTVRTGETETVVPVNPRDGDPFKSTRALTGGIGAEPKTVRFETAAGPVTLIFEAANPEHANLNVDTNARKTIENPYWRFGIYDTVHGKQDVTKAGYTNTLKVTIRFGG